MATQKKASKKPAKSRPPSKRKPAKQKSKKEAARRGPLKLREAIAAAIGQDRELMSEVRGGRPATRKQWDRSAGEAGTRTAIGLAADALEPVLSDAVRRHPSVLGRIAYGTAQLLTTLASEDRDSTKRLAEIAGAGHVGIVFVDVVGFTAYTASNGDEAAVALVERLERIVASVVTRYQGEVVKHLGDGFLLAFPSASQAIRAAVAMRDAAAKARATDPSFQPVRIAVHAGRPAVVGDDLIGHDVNLTARLLEYCEPGEVLVTEEAKKLAERRLKSCRFTDARRVKVRGIPEEVRTYRVDAVRPATAGAVPAR